jgi:hypothetical protein
MKLQDLEKLAKRANQRLRQLEKSGVAEMSAAYRSLMLKAYDNVGAMKLNKEGKPVFRRDYSKMSMAELAELSQGLEAFTKLKTTTVRSTKSAAERSYRTFAARQKERGEKPISKEEYKNLWTSSATKAFGYEKVMRIAKKTGATMKQIESALAKAVEEQDALGRELSERNLMQRVINSQEQQK